MKSNSSDDAEEVGAWTEDWILSTPGEKQTNLCYIYTVRFLYGPVRTH